MSIPKLSAWRNNYRARWAALPWLDAAVYPQEHPLLPRAPSVVGESPATSILRPGCAIDNAPTVWRYRPSQSGSLSALTIELQGLSIASRPLAILHTDIPIPDIAELASKWPNLPLIIESGPRKLLYHLLDLESALQEHPNLHLCTYNFCNWLGLERMVSAGHATRLLHGSHGPRFCADAAMGPVILSDIDWSVACDIAGNNLRRLLGQPPVKPPEVKRTTPRPFLIDMHTHSVQPGDGSALPFPSPDAAFAPQDWLSTMDAMAVAQVVVMPNEALREPSLTCRDLTRKLRQHDPGRFYYHEVYNPQGDATHRQRVRQSLAEDPACLGIKIHPPFHQTAADDDSYRPAWEMAAAADVPILTHSWEDSDYNPVQKLSLPRRFTRWLEDFPTVPLVLGHSGGRPSTYAEVVALGQQFPQLYSDISGDYFDTWMVESMVAGLGEDRVLFGSDLDWIEPHCILGVTLGSACTDAQLEKLLSQNARRLFTRLPELEA